MIERVLKLFVGAVIVVVLLKYPWAIVNVFQAFTDAVVRTADALVHLKLTGGSAPVAK